MTKASIRAHFEGTGILVALPGEDEYEARRQLWNAMIDRKPLAIAPCRTTHAVTQAVAIARKLGCGITVKGGGHNIAGAALADGALLIDLSDNRAVSVDVEKRVAIVESGAMLADVDRATQAHGLAVPLGIASETGVAGLALGGGMGWLAREHGLTCDNLLAAEVVLADGTVRRVEAASDPDLFWALQGGGGVGIVTRFEFRLHPLGPNVLFGPTMFALQDGADALRLWERFMADAPRAATIWVDIAKAPPAPFLPPEVHGTPVVILLQCWTGDPTEGLSLLRQIHEHPAALGSWVVERPFVDAQQFIDETYAKGARNYWSPSAHAEVSDALIDQLLTLGAELPSDASDILLCHLGGAVDDVAAAATAYPHRGARVMAVPGARFNEPGEDARMITWAKQAGASLARIGSSAAYVNFMSDRDARHSDAYGANAARLAQIKATYDPDGVFIGVRKNQSAA